jgi:hypothetical protein
MEEALSVSQKINYSAGEACALVSIAYYIAMDGKIHEADSLLKRAESLAEKIGDPNLTGILLYRIGMKKLNTGIKKEWMIFLRQKKYLKIQTITIS